MVTQVSTQYGRNEEELTAGVMLPSLDAGDNARRQTVRTILPPCSLSVVSPHVGAPLSSQTAETLAATFAALGEPARLRIVHALLQGERRVGALAEAVGLAVPAVSQHLRVLRDLRIVRHRRDGRMVYYALDDAHVAELLTVALTHVQGDQHQPINPWPAAAVAWRTTGGSRSGEERCTAETGGATACEGTGAATAMRPTIADSDSRE